MNNDLLHHTAALIRERAQAATPGPWTLWDRGVGWEIPELPDVHDGTTFTQADATHIASWHPDVALAVADLLDEVAEDIAGAFSPNAYAEANEYARRALTVARAYLADPATPASPERPSPEDTP